MDENMFRTPNSLTEMLDNLGVDNPRLRLVAEMMDKQKPEQAGRSPSEKKLAIKKQALSRIEKLIQQNRELREENHVVRERLELLASSLGACPDCWGEDQACSVCRGRGAPGGFLPDRDAFVGYVLPAVRKIHPYISRDKPSKSGIGKDTPDIRKNNPVDE
ncbi:MAG: hypothetical protein WAM61_13745 [Desulfobacterales bacterium]